VTAAPPSWNASAVVSGAHDLEGALQHAPQSVGQSDEHSDEGAPQHLHNAGAAERHTVDHHVVIHDAQPVEFRQDAAGETRRQAEATLDQAAGTAHRGRDHQHPHGTDSSQEKLEHSQHPVLADGVQSVDVQVPGGIGHLHKSGDRSSFLDSRQNHAHHVFVELASRLSFLFFC
jgi:hypothetical protein